METDDLRKICEGSPKNHLVHIFRVRSWRKNKFQTVRSQVNPIVMEFKTPENLGNQSLQWVKTGLSLHSGQNMSKTVDLWPETGSHGNSGKNREKHAVFVAKCIFRDKFLFGAISLFRSHAHTHSGKTPQLDQNQAALLPGKDPSSSSHP